MEKFQSKVKHISGGRTVQETLAEVEEMSHTFREVVVLGVCLDGKVIMRRTQMTLSDLTLASAVLQANVTDEILDLT